MVPPFDSQDAAPATTTQRTSQAPSLRMTDQMDAARGATESRAATRNSSPRSLGVHSDKPTTGSAEFNSSRERPSRRERLFFFGLPALSSSLRRMSARKQKIVVVYRSAVTGRIVPRAYAEKHPKTTIRETVRR
jgi:hypothetical protein